MKSITDDPLLQEMVESCHYFWETGWGENHAGNVSYILDDKELARLEPFFHRNPVSVAFPYDTHGLVGRVFLTTRSGGQFRTIRERAEKDLCIVRVEESHINILWGCDGGTGRPTSELPAHLLCHAVRLGSDLSNRIIMHCHPTYLNAMTCIADLDEEKFTKALWGLNSECVLVFPEGIGVLPWMVCGEGPIGPATAKKMKSYRLVVWPFHGLFGSGSSFDEVIGLIETVEKNAQVYVLTSGSLKQCISGEGVQLLASHFGLRTRFQ